MITEKKLKIYPELLLYHKIQFILKKIKQDGFAKIKIELKANEIPILGYSLKRKLS